jgi:hypothetical protein
MLVGIWVNGLGSKMEIEGRIRGTKIRTRWDPSYIDANGNIKLLRAPSSFEQTQ